jgi:hypothetical protein
MEKKQENIKTKNTNNIDKVINVLMFISCLVFIFGMTYLLFNGIENPFVYP